MARRSSIVTLSETLLLAEEHWQVCDSSWDKRNKICNLEVEMNETIPNLCVLFKDVLNFKRVSVSAIDERAYNNGGIIFTEKIQRSVKIRSPAAATCTTNNCG